MQLSLPRAFKISIRDDRNKCHARVRCGSCGVLVLGRVWFQSFKAPSFWSICSDRSLLSPFFAAPRPTAEATTHALPWEEEATAYHKEIAAGEYSVACFGPFVGHSVHLGQRMEPHENAGYPLRCATRHVSRIAT